VTTTEGNVRGIERVMTQWREQDGAADARCMNETGPRAGSPAGAAARLMVVASVTDGAPCRRHLHERVVRMLMVDIWPSVDSLPRLETVRDNPSVPTVAGSTLNIPV
jgi:hypothetical protein